MFLFLLLKLAHFLFYVGCGIISVRIAPHLLQQVGSGGEFVGLYTLQFETYDKR